MLSLNYLNSEFLSTTQEFHYFAGGGLLGILIGIFIGVELTLRISRSMGRPTMSRRQLVSAMRGRRR